MKHLFSFSFLLVASSLVVACSSDKLDGGSNTSGSSSSSSSSSGASGTPPGAAQEGIEDTPFAGTVIGQPFAPTAFELRQARRPT
jgi:hypothetical protein